MTEPSPASSSRVFLFLQGPSSSLFAKIGKELAQHGHKCLRINLSIGDRLFWWQPGARNYRGSFQDWGSFISLYLNQNGVTDLILLGEERPYHKVAVAAAKALGVEITVIEMGYLRPDWVTIERDGMSSNSRFPNDPAIIRQAAAGLAAPDYSIIYNQTFLTEAILDVTYNLPNAALWFLYPGYRRHALYHPIVEYAGWIRRLLGAKRRRTEAVEQIEELLRQGHPYYLYPLQLETDYQLRAHSPYRCQSEAIEHVLSSFSAHAAGDTHLVIKVHPLDNGLVDWAGEIERIANRLGIGARVRFLDGGDLGLLIGQSLGQVTVNSTTALHGLRRGVPAMVLGAAIYDVAGMTHQTGLDKFWTDPQRPDMALTCDFYRLLASSIQVKGNFYSRQGTAAAARGIADRLMRRTVNQPGGDLGYPPRVRPIKFGTGNGVLL